MRRLLPAIVAVAALHAAPALAAQSGNVKLLANIPELPTAISINFIGDAMFVSTVDGVWSYDVSDPAKPRRLGVLPMYIWENEDVDVDPVRKRLFVSRDPRGFTSPAVPGDVFPYGAVHIIDVSDPAAMRQLNVFFVPAGHTTTCVNACDVIWTSGPYANKLTQPDFVGRPVYATDVSDPMNPNPCPDPIDTGRNDGVTDYAHDVQVDAQGIAWVSGAGGVRGYWTSGEHANPVTGATETATGCHPVGYAGSGTPESATPSRFMHNAWRDWTAPVTAATKVKAKRRRHHKRHRHNRHHRPRAAAIARNDLLLATEENTVTDCKTSGRFVIYDLRGTYGGEGFKDTATTHHRMTPLGTWTPEHAEGATGCDSSHYFSSRGDGITVNAFYSQGVRFLDTTDPAHIRQVGYFLGDGANTWAAYWHKGNVFVADFGRGVDVLSFEGGHASRSVRAPLGAARSQPLAFSRDVFRGLCPLAVPR